MASTAQAVEDVACGVVIIHPVKTANHREHPLQLSKTRQFEACRKLRPTAEKDPQRTICRPGEQLSKIHHDVAAKPLSVIDHKYRRPSPLIALHRRTKPARPCRSILAAAGYLQFFGNYGDQLVEDEPGPAALDHRMAGRPELSAKTPKQNGLS